MAFDPFQYFNPAAVMQKLDGDTAIASALVDAYLKELGPQIAKLAPDAVASDIKSARSVLHQLRTTFGMFEASRGQELERWIMQALDAGEMPPEDTWHALVCEMVGLGCDLRRFVAQNRQSTPTPKGGDA
ncbi:Hpt domain-containing protein [Chitinimonas naiadis]